MNTLAGGGLFKMMVRWDYNRDGLLYVSLEVNEGGRVTPLCKKIGRTK